MMNSPVIRVRKNVYQYRKGMLHRIVVCDGQIELRQIIIVNVEGRYMRRDIYQIREIAIVFFEMLRVLSYAVYQLGNVVIGII